MITVNRVSKSFDNHAVLKNISATFEKGKTNLIIGQSGSGKTVLLKCIVGLFDVVEGDIMYDDVCFNKLEFHEKKEIRKQIGMLFQSGALFDSAISGGMQKRVAIARAIALKPKYLFCDEPNSGLDPKTSIVIDELIKEITDEYDITTIVNTHDMNSVMGIGDKIIFIYRGEKWWEGTKEDVLHSNNKEFNDFVFASALTRKIKAYL